MIHQNNLYFLRFSLACLIVFNHSEFLVNTLEQQKEELFKFPSLRVPTFFLISGLLIYSSLLKSSSIKSYLRNRLIRILPLFFLTILLTTIVCGFFYDGTYIEYLRNSSTWKYLGRNFSIVGLTHHIDGVFTQNPHQAINGSLWSTPYLIICYLSIAPLLILHRKYSQKTISIVLLTTFSILFILFNVSHFLPAQSINEQTSTLLRLLLIFYMGILISRFFVAHQLPKKIVVISTISFIALIVLSNIFNSSYFNSLTIIPYAFIIIFLAFIPNKTLPKFAQYGDPSYGIYLLAFPIQQILIAKFPQWNSFTNASVTLIIVIPISYLTWHYFEKPISNWNKKFKKNINTSSAHHH